MVSDSNKFVLIRSEGRGSVEKQIVSRTASTYELLVKAQVDYIEIGYQDNEAVQRPTGALWLSGMQITSINETSG